MNLKINQNGSAITIPLQSSASAPRLAVRYNNTNFYAPFVATGTADASPLHICIGNSAFALSNGAQPAVALLTAADINATSADFRNALHAIVDDPVSAFGNSLGYMPKDATQVVELEGFVVNHDYDESLGNWYMPPDSFYWTAWLDESNIEDFGYAALVIRDMADWSADFFFDEILVSDGKFEFIPEIAEYSYVVLFILQ